MTEENKTVISPSLSTEGLRKLSKVMYYKGAQAIHTMKFKSEYERARYLQSCWETYFHTHDLLNTTETAIKEHKDDRDIAPIVKGYAEYVGRAVGFAHNSIVTYERRAEYIKKVKEVVCPILLVLNEHKHSPIKEAKLTQLAEEIGHLNRAMFKYEQAASSTSRKFVRAARTCGMTFQTLIRRYQSILGFKGKFEILGTELQLQVLDKVIECTGRGKKLAKFGKKSIKVLNKHSLKAIMAITALAVAIDVYSADPDERYETAVKSIVTLGSSFLIGYLQSILYFEVAFVLICTGNPVLIALGIAIAVGTYFAGDKIQDFVDCKVTPVVVDFMNDHKQEIEQYVMPVVDFVNDHQQEVETLVLIIKDVLFFQPLLLIKLKPTQESSPDTKPTPTPVVVISTFGLKVRGPQVPDGRVVARQIAYKAR